MWSGQPQRGRRTGKHENRLRSGGRGKVCRQELLYHACMATHVLQNSPCSKFQATEQREQTDATGTA